MLELLILANTVQSESGKFVTWLTFGDGLVYFLIGFLVVVLGIILLVVLVSLFGMLMKKTNGLAFFSKKQKKPSVEVVKAEPIAASAQSDDIPEQVRIAIFAAISAYYADAEVPQCEFKIKKIRKI